MLVEIFYHVDNFCQLFQETVEKKGIDSKGESRRNRSQSLSLSEILTICIYFHLSGYKDFKSYYTKHVLVHMQKDFKKLVSYNRFIELKKNAVLPLMMFLQLYGKAACMGVSYIDSFSLSVSHNKRIHSHKVFKGIAQRGKTSMGWFYGFKVHIVINHLGEIINFYISPGNVSDNNENLLEKLTKEIKGKLFGDKGYIVNKNVFEQLYSRGLHLVTKIRKNMKNILMDMQDKLGLRQRGLVESCIGIFKESLSIEHSRHRSPINFLCHILSALTAYVFRPKKPSIIRKRRLIEQTS